MTKRFILFFGPSGAGKCTLARFMVSKAAPSSFLWVTDHPKLDFIARTWQAENRRILERDNPYPHPLKALLTKLHTSFFQVSKPVLLIEMQSNIYPNPEALKFLNDSGICTPVLFSAIAHCREAFLKRERENQSGLRIEHWRAHNPSPQKFASADLAPWRIDTSDSGGWITPAQLQRKLEAQLRWAS